MTMTFEVPLVLELTLMSRLVPYSLCIIGGVVENRKKYNVISFDHSECPANCTAVAKYPTGYDHEKFTPRFIAFLAYH